MGGAGLRWLPMVAWRQRMPAGLVVCLMDLGARQRVWQPVAAVAVAAEA